MLPLSVLVVYIGSLILDQSPRLMAYPPASSFRGGEPECTIFKAMEHASIGSEIHLKFNVSGRFQSSIENSWRSVRVLVRGKYWNSVYHQNAFKSKEIHDDGTMEISFEGDILSNSTEVDVYCTNSKLGSFTTKIDFPVNTRYSYQDDTIHNFCLSDKNTVIFSNHIVTNTTMDVVHNGIDVNYQRGTLYFLNGSVIEVLTYAYLHPDRQTLAVDKKMKAFGLKNIVLRRGECFSRLEYESERPTIVEFLENKEKMIEYGDEQQTTILDSTGYVRPNSVYKSKISIKDLLKTKTLIVDSSFDISLCDLMKPGSTVFVVGKTEQRIHDKSITLKVVESKEQIFY